MDMQRKALVMHQRTGNSRFVDVIPLIPVRGIYFWVFGPGIFRAAVGDKDKANWEWQIDDLALQTTGLCIMVGDSKHAINYFRVKIKGYINRSEFPKEDVPHAWHKPNYDKKIQYADGSDNLPLLDKKGIKTVQSAIGLFQYYARAVDETMLKALNTLATQQKDLTECTLCALVKFMNYAATHYDAKVQFHASVMILHILSDASYLNESKARSTGAGKFFLNGHLESAYNPELYHDNGALNVLCTIIKVVVGSTAEAEPGTFYFNSQEGVPICCCLRNWVIHNTPVISEDREFQV